MTNHDGASRMVPPLGSGWRRARAFAVALLVAASAALAAAVLETIEEEMVPSPGRWVRPHVYTDLAAGFLAGLVAFLVLGRSARRRAELAEATARRGQAELALDERRRLLESVIASIPHPFFYKDRAGLYQGCNKAFADFLGLPRERIVGHGVRDVAPPDLAATYQAADEALFREPGSQVYEAQVESRDGRRRTVVFHKATFDGPDGRPAGIVGSMLDITDRREAENRTRLAVAVLDALNLGLDHADTLRKILRLFRDMGVDAVGLRLREGEDYPYYVTDGFTDEFVRLERSLCVPDGADCLRDAAGCAVLECVCGLVLKGESLPGASCMTPVGSFWTNAASELQTCAEKFRDGSVRVRGRCPAMGYESLALIPLRNHGETLGLLQVNYRRRNALTLDQVQFFEGLGASIGVALRRKRGEERLAESEATWHRIFNGMHEGILGADIETRHFVLANDAVCRMLGYTREELLNLGVKDVHLPEDLPDVARHFERLVKGDLTTVTDRRFLRKDGGTFYAELSVVLVTLAGRPCAVATLRDISERRRFEAEIVRAREEAESANRAKSQFLANMSHELRTPLNPIIGFAGMLMEAQNLTDEQRTHVALVKQRSEDLLALINDILDLSKIEAEKLELHLEDVGLRRVLADAVRTTELAARTKGLALGARVDEEVPDAVQADPLRLRQVLVNLLSNAVKFTERGEVECRVLPWRGEPIARRAGVGEVAVHVVVRDTGIGIPEDRLQAVFEPFQQADGSLAKRFGGTGLGLAISRRLVGLMGGKLWAESRPGQGSAFHFTAVLLRAQSQAVAEAEAVFRKTVAPRPSADAGPALKVLIVEDDPSSRLLAGGVLRRAGHTVAFAETAAEALARLEEQTFDAVLMDIQLPGMDGVAATRTIRERDRASGRHTVIVALTAFAMKGDRERFLEAGMDGYVSKPFDRADLLETLRRTAEKTRSASSGAAPG